MQTGGGAFDLGGRNEGCQLSQAPENLETAYCFTTGLLHVVMDDSFDWCPSAALSYGLTCSVQMSHQL